MTANITIILFIVAVTSVAAQTFQYSRGWTNGKRDGHKREVVANNLERILSPCQMSKLKYVLEGKPLNERFFGPCDFADEDLEIIPKRYKTEHSPEPSLDVF